MDRSTPEGHLLGIERLFEVSDLVASGQDARIEGVIDASG
jgi:hypothetical protein